jgi:hypothetical protein
LAKDTRLLLRHSSESHCGRGPLIVDHSCLMLSVGGASVSEPDRTNLDALAVVKRGFSYSRSVDEGTIGAAEIPDKRRTTLKENFCMSTGHGCIIQNDVVEGIATYLDRLNLVEWILATTSINQPSADCHCQLPPKRRVTIRF